MSGGGGGTNTVTQSGPPEWAIPYYKSYFDKASAVSDLPYQPYTGQRIADLNQYQTGGLNATANRAIQGAQEVGQARNQLGSTLSGDYLGQQAPGSQNPYYGSNPYMQGMIDTASNDVISKYNTVTRPQLDAAMARSGSFGNSGIQQMQGQALGDLTKNLGDIQNRFRFQDYTTQQGLGEAAANRAFQGYENERNRQLQGIGMAPQLAAQDYIDAAALTNAGDAFNRYNQSQLDTDYANFLEARNYPYQQLAPIASALGLNAGSAGSSSSNTPGNPAAGALGGAALGYGLGGSAMGSALGMTGPYGALAGAALGALGSK
jgi:hypothetical protein